MVDGTLILHSDTSPGPDRMTRGWIVVDLISLSTMSDEDLLGRLANRSSRTGFASTANLQISAWRDQLVFLRLEIQKLVQLEPEATNWTLILEYEIPRRQKRIDVVLLTENVIFSIELKLGAGRYERADLWQAEDYALVLLCYKT